MKKSLLSFQNVSKCFQQASGDSHMTVWENILLPAWIAGDERKGGEHRAPELRERVGLANRARDPASMLSCGEMQRVALCRVEVALADREDFYLEVFGADLFAPVEIPWDRGEPAFTDFSRPLGKSGCSQCQPHPSYRAPT